MDDVENERTTKNYYYYFFFLYGDPKWDHMEEERKPMHQLFSPRQPFRVLLLIKIMRKCRSKREKKIMSNGKEFK